MNGRAREVLASLADLLVPPGDGMPSALEAGVASAGIDRVLAACPELESPLVRLLDRGTPPDPAGLLDELRTDPQAFGLLAFAVVGAYLTEPRVMDRLGYRGRPVAPVADDLDAGVRSLLESVLERGPVYRDPDATPQRRAARAT